MIPPGNLFARVVAHGFAHPARGLYPAIGCPEFRGGWANGPGEEPCCGATDVRLHARICFSFSSSRLHSSVCRGPLAGCYRLLQPGGWGYQTVCNNTGSGGGGGGGNYNATFAFELGPKGTFRNRPLPVHSFAPNPWGLYQVHGNVLEWLEDCSIDATWKSYGNAPSDGSAQTAPDCKAHMLRGGAWDDLPRTLRSATRGNAFHSSRNYAYGFRVARDLER